MLARGSLRAQHARVLVFYLLCQVTHAHLLDENSTCPGVHDAQGGTTLLQFGISDPQHAYGDLKQGHRQQPSTGHLGSDRDVKVGHQQPQTTGHPFTSPTTGHPLNFDLGSLAQAFERVRPKLKEHKEARTVACICFCLMFCFCAVHLLRRHDVHFLPESILFIALGVALGAVLKNWARADFMQQTCKAIQPSDFLSLVLLPPLMFESGWMMRRLDFISQLPYILNFAVLGTLISILVIGVLIYDTGRLGLHGVKNYRSAFTISTIISATDPVAVLGTYADLKVEPLLNIIVSGEAILNDAVALVVFDMLNLEGMNGISIEGFWSGMRVFCGSALVSVMLTVLHCWTLRIVNLRQSKKLEILLVLTTAYLAYAMGEFLDVSGIISTLMSGILMGQYARPHLSVEGCLLTTFLIGQMCTVIDMAIFLLCGVAFLVICPNLSGVILGGWLMLFCLLGRFCSTYLCGWLTNYMKQQVVKSQGIQEADANTLTSSHLLMIWHAGLRGAIAFWMSTHVGNWMDELDGQGTRLALQSAVLLLIAVFIVVFGGTTRLCLQWLEIPWGHSYAEDFLSKTEMFPWVSTMLSWTHDNVLFPSLVGQSFASGDSNAFISSMNHQVDAEEVIRVALAPHRAVTEKTRYDDEFYTSLNRQLSTPRKGTEGLSPRITREASANILQSIVKGRRDAAKTT
mmetsp:Transcript_55710/g.104815  ORF Transcript_55710/g.104815 Transcript_55710/m.104815 type:complete len:685 (+) Transcript_55710:83-2137(+)